MLQGKSVNLRKASIDDVSLIVKWWADQQYMGDHQEIVVLSKEEIEKIMLHHTIFFIIEKNQAPVGHINGWMRGRTIEIGFALVPNERAKGLGTEAIQMMLDHLFITTDSARIQVSTNVRNIASQRALEKAGFRREGTMRRSGYVRGQYRDRYLYSVIREEWKKPRILTDITG